MLGHRLVLWGWEIGTSDAVLWAPLRNVLAEVENYQDGKPEGQKTEVDAIVFSKTSLVVIECKRMHGLGRCSRFEDKRCPEINLERRKRPYCQYWARGLKELVEFSKPTPATSFPECSEYYQLMRNYMIGLRLANELGLRLHLMVVKATNSPDFKKTKAEVDAFNRTTSATSKYVLTCWSDFRVCAGSDTKLLMEYVAELPRSEFRPQHSSPAVSSPE
jgi:hypothetical protein